ncbi:hypothetical protein D9M68_705040 [compost metagenome]
MSAISTSARSRTASSLVSVNVQSGASRVSGRGGLGTPTPLASDTPRFNPFRWSSLV